MSPSTKTDQLTIDIHALSPEQGVKRVLDFAAEHQASDVLLASEENRVAVYMRYMGVHRLITVLNADLGKHCQAHIRAAAHLDFAEHRVPLDAHWKHSGADGQRIDLRVSVIPTLYGEDVNLRLLNRRSQAVQLDKLGMLPLVHHQVREAIESPSGLVLVTGPTGAGKTTTLYAMLEHLSQGQRKINTVEDPIEYSIPGIRQSNINPNVNLGFPELLRAVFRQAPDVIMIGEIRDPVTAETAVRAGNSGHLVLATLHAPGASSAVFSLENFGVVPHFLGPSLNCVLSQRLVRTLCPKCRQPNNDIPWPQLFEEITSLRSADSPRQCYVAGGCEECHGTGYRSRTGVHELLLITKDMRHLIYNKATAGEIYRQGLHEGMISFRKAAFYKVGEGETSIAEIRRVFPAEFLQD